MATSSFDKRFEVTKPENVEKLYKILTSKKPVKPIDRSLCSPDAQMRSEQLLKQYLSHSKS